MLTLSKKIEYYNENWRKSAEKRWTFACNFPILTSKIHTFNKLPTYERRP